MKCDSHYIDIKEVPKNIQLSRKEPAAKQSLMGGQGYKKCQCKSSGVQCQTKRCACFKAKILCSSSCHSSSTCSNK